MTIFGLEACLLAPATLELDDVHLKMLHQRDTNDLQRMQSVCLKLGFQISEPITHPVNGRLIPAHSPISYSPTPLFSIIDPQHANKNDNQWRHLYAFSTLQIKKLWKKRRDPFVRTLACLLLDQYIWKMNVSVCMENNQIIVWVCQHAVFKNLGVYPYPVVPQCYKLSISHPNTTLLTKMLITYSLRQK